MEKKDHGCDCVPEMQQGCGFLNSTSDSLASFSSFSIFTVTVLFVLWSDEVSCQQWFPSWC